MLALCFRGSPNRAEAQTGSEPAAAAGSARCCMSETGVYVNGDPGLMRKRFALYRQMGVGMVRAGLSWRDQEISEGVWRPPPTLPYLKLIGEAGFKIKLNLETMAGPPAWYLKAHPDARIVNQNGVSSVNCMSLWYPGLEKVLAEKAERLIRSLAADPAILSAVEFLDPDFGPASEPIYPAAWTMGPDYKEGETFWCYDQNAQADFGRKMRAHYGEISAANAKWKTDYADWSQVRVPKPGTRAGAFWEDVLVWYRDSKRDFIRWQLANFRTAWAKVTGRPIQIILYVPGSDYSDEDWQQAVATGAGNARIALMCDSKFMIETAGQQKCWLQYTGSENTEEVRHLRGYMDEHRLGAVPMWGENAGSERGAGDPMHLADVIIENGLYGLDYTHSRFLFESDTITPNATFSQLQQAFTAIREHRDVPPP